MQTLPSLRERTAQCSPPPVAVWQTLLACLLEQHYGLTLNDTPFGNDAIIQDHINAGVSLADALNFIVEKYELVRTDRTGFSVLEQSPFINSIDILRARKASGMMKREGYQDVTAITCGQSRRQGQNR